MKSTSILLILAMVGTGFGQDVKPLPSNCARNSNNEMYCDTINAAKLSDLHLAPAGRGSYVIGDECADGEKVVVHNVPVATCVDSKWRIGEDSVDIPAIQEPLGSIGFCRNTEEEASQYAAKYILDGAYMKRDPEADFGCLDHGRSWVVKNRYLWTCADENRALLTSVNGKRHSCHRIEP